MCLPSETDSLQTHQEFQMYILLFASATPKYKGRDLDGAPETDPDEIDSLDHQ